MEKINLLLVDDRDVIRDAIKVLFKSSSIINITGEAENGIEAIRLISLNNYDVILMDINMPNLDGLETTKRILKIKPNAKILCFSILTNIKYIKEMIDVGVMGYISKDVDKKMLLNAIVTVANNDIYLSDDIRELMLNDYLTRLELCS